MHGASKVTVPALYERDVLARGLAQIVEITLHVALNTLTNYINEVGGTDIDFPVVPAKAA